jgi:hypothetical protein
MSLVHNARISSSLLAGAGPELRRVELLLGKINEFNGVYVAAEMVKAFLDSAEYRNRFGQ